MRPGGVLVLGLDGGTLRVLRPMAAAGLMPAFDRLLAQGRAGTLRSTLPWYTIPGWTSLMTGVGPGTHGLLYWVVSGEEEYFEGWRRGRRFVTSADISHPTFWDIAGAAGKRVAVLNMPLTYPAWPVNGAMITGLLTPKEAKTGACYPADLLDRFPGYRVDLSISRAAHSPDTPPSQDVDLPAYLRELIELTEGRARVGSALLADEVDLGVVVFVGPDRISHRAWPEQAAVAEGRGSTGEIESLIEAYYKALDRAVGDLIEACGPWVTVMVVADHGFGPPPDYTFTVNEWLRRSGYLTLRSARARKVVASSPVIKRLARPLIRRLRRRRGSPSERALVNWSRTAAYGVAYSRTPMFGLVVNRVGVKAEGSVSPQDAAQLVRRLQGDLMTLTDERGRRVVRRSWTREELGANARGFPDLLVETEPEISPWDGLLATRSFAPFELPSGLHARDGVFIVSGAGVRDPGRADADILDVAPTVLGLLGIAAPDHLEGKTREDILDLPERVPPPLAVTGPGGRAADISVDEEREIEAHLRTLGYTD